MRVRILLLLSSLLMCGCTQVLGKNNADIIKQEIREYSVQNHGSFFSDEKDTEDLRIVFVDNHWNFNWEVLYGMFEDAGVQVFFEDNTDFSIDEYDALILGGGYDMDPSFYSEENKGSEDIDIEEDRLQLKAADFFVSAGKPVLGICRGMQLLNVYFGGTLIQDMDNHRGAERTVALREHSFFADSLGDQVNVSCWHHQAVKKPGEDLIITMYDAEDLMIEGFEHKYLPVYGIQWHPEGSECGRKVIDAFLKKVLQEANRRESDFVLPRNKRKQELIPEKRGRLLLVSKGD